MKKRHIIIIVAILLVASDAFAQRHRTKSTRQVVKNGTMLVVNAYLDSLLASRHRLDSAFLSSDSLSERTPDARYFRLFAPLTFYHSPADKSLALYSNTSGRDRLEDEIDNALMSVYLNRPDLVKATESQLEEAGTIRDDFDKPVKKDVELSEIVEPLPVEEQVVVPSSEVMIQKPNFWTFSGESYFQLLQNYISSNWYNGGESNYSMLAQVTLNAIYNNKSGVKFENKLELKLGFQTSPSDTVHSMKANNDLIRYTGRLSLTATKNWAYSVQLLAYTQFARGYKSNDTYVYSDFMSPFTLNLGIGMTYTVSAFDKKLTGTVNLSPLSFNWKYVDRMDLASRNGISEGHHSIDDYGSQITTELTWKFNSHVSWKTRLYGYTTYKRSVIEWENTITFSLMKYLSTNIFLYPRFDDSSTRDGDLGYWQFKEYCSLGLTYSF